MVRGADAARRPLLHSCSSGGIVCGRKFTPDGHLVGSIGEAMAAHMFDLRLLPAATPKHDATTADGRTFVQIN